VATAKRTTCRMRSYWISPEGRIDNISTCSGFKLLPDVLGTAGHCIYNQVTTERCDA
jgi:V8-like Glu-specific endopeptidase